MSESQYGNPVFIPSNDTPRVLERVGLGGSGSGGLYSEGWLQKLLFEHPEALPFSEIDQAFTGAIPVCTELGTQAGPLDVLYVTPQGKLVILESKLWRNPEARRKVVGQVLDYAKEISKLNYEGLQRQVARATGRKGNVLYEVVKSSYPEVDEAKFVDEVSRGLRTGRFLLLIAGDGIREGVGAITEFLDRYGSLEFTFGLIEMAVYRFNEEELLVQPRILAKSMIYKRSVVVSELPDIVIEEDIGGHAEEEEIPEKTRYIREFWVEFLKELELDDPSQPSANPGKGGNIYFYPVSNGPFWISAYLAPSSNQIGVYLRFAKSEYGEAAFEALSADKQEIIDELGGPVSWEETGPPFSIVCRLKGVDALDKARREEVKAFLADRVNQFINVFRPRLTAFVENT